MSRLVISLGRQDSAQGQTVAEVNSLLTDVGLRNVFNPSVCVVDAQAHVAFRAFGALGQKPFDAFYGRRVSDQWAVENLTEHAAQWGVGPVADPKLFTTAAGVHATFNSGTPLQGPNEVYVMDVWPHLGPPRRCVVADRQRVEKNWAFFESARGLSAVYSLDPLVILDAAPDEPGGPVVLHRRSFGGGWLTTGGSLRRLTLGTQPLAATGARQLMIAHEKFWIRGRRSYVGRPLVLTGVDSEQPTLHVAGRRLIHTVRDALPRVRPVHNPNLLSATYFSGLTRVDGGYLLSYGVNDLSFGLARVGDDLWVP